MEGVIGSAFADTLTGNADNNEIRGGAGNDTISGLGGNDILRGDAGADTISGGSGTDMFVMNDVASIDTISDYAAGEIIDVTSLITSSSGLSGYVRLLANGDLQVDTNGGGDGFTTIAHINTASVDATVLYSTPTGTATLTVIRGAPPVALDMDGDGQISFIGTDAGAAFDYGAGRVATAWVAGNDGILVNDANHDGQASASEIVFATSGSDLEGLAVYDSNHDGQLSSADSAFADFQVWQDANSNGLVDSGEMRSLTALGIVSIGLSSDGIGYSAANGDVTVVGTGSYTRADGSTGVLADAVFATGARAELSQVTASAATNASLTSAVLAAGVMALTAGVDSHASAQPHFDAGEFTHLPPIVGTPHAVLAEQTNHALGGETRLPVDDAQSTTMDNGHAVELPAVGTDHATAAAGNAGLSDLLQATDARIDASVQQPHAAQVSAVSADMLQAAMQGVAAVQNASAAADHAGLSESGLGQVLADALQGGQAAAEVDALLAAISHQADGGHAAFEHSLAHLAATDAHPVFGPASFAHASLALEPMVAHFDAPPAS
jgi:hypothetical protein